MDNVVGLSLEAEKVGCFWTQRTHKLTFGDSIMLSHHRIIPMWLSDSFMLNERLSVGPMAWGGDDAQLKT